MSCSSWRNSFLSEEEIEILRHWVSCLNPRISEFSSSDLSVNKYKHKIQKNLWRRAVLQGRWSKRYCLKKYLLQVLSIWNWILNAAIAYSKKGSAHACQWQFKCFSWKMFCPVQVNAQLHIQITIWHSISLSCCRSEWAWSERARLSRRIFLLNVRNCGYAQVEDLGCAVVCRKELWLCSNGKI